MKSVVTKHEKICCICGRAAEAEHHLVFGTAGRMLSEKDGLKIPLCNNCHNMGKAVMTIHGNPMAEKLSKIIGQLAWERKYILDRSDNPKLDTESRENFRKRYGRSYL